MKWLVLCVCAAAVLWGGCAQEVEPLLPIRQDLLDGQGAEQRSPLGSIAGRPVQAASFEAFWHEHPQMDRQQAWDAFVVQQLAASHRLEHNPDVLASGELEDAHRRGLARAWLDKHVESSTWKDLPKARLEQLERSISEELSTPQGLQASHLLVSVPRGRYDASTKTQVELTEPERDALMVKARAFAQTMRAAMPPISDSDMLEAQRLKFLPQARAQGLDLVVNAHMKFPVEQRRGPLPEGWINVVPAFAEGAQSASQAGQGLSEAVETQFGVHFILVEESFPTRRPSPERLQRVLRQRATKDIRTRRFQAQTSDLIDRTPRQMFPKELEGPVYTQ